MSHSYFLVTIRKWTSFQLFNRVFNFFLKTHWNLLKHLLYFFKSYKIKLEKDGTLIMKLAIIGSRGLNVDVAKYVENIGNIELVISGGARGIDTCAEIFADNHDIPKKIFLPDYETYGRRAPLVRNIDIVNECDEVLAFWDGCSNGTTFTLKEAKKQGKKIHLFKVKPEI